MYIAAGDRGYWNVQGTIPIGSGEWVMGNMFFNDGAENVGPGNGYFDMGPGTDPEFHKQFTYPEDTWFKVVMNVDISLGIGASTVQYFIDGTEVVAADTPFTEWESGVYPTSLGGIDFWSNSPENHLYVDSFTYQDSFILGTQSFEATGFRSALNNNYLNFKELTKKFLTYLYIIC